MTNTDVLPTRAKVTSSGRIAVLDVARGIAILGTLWTNIWLFTHTHGLAGYLQNPVTEGTPGWARTAGAAVQALSQGKFLALLTLLFGMGLAIQQDAAARRGQRWPGRYLWRAALLFLDGLINYVLIAEFDVLMGYAVTAAVVSWLLLTSDRAQRRMVTAFATAHVILVTLIALVASTVEAPRQAWSGANPYAEWSFWGLAAFRLENLAAFRAETILIFFGSVAMFLLGARLFRGGIFTERGAALRRRLMSAGLVAWPLDLLLGVSGGVAGVLVERYLLAPVVALGLLALIAEVGPRRSHSWVGRRLSEVGRTALSCYLLQNLIAGAVFYGWGIGLASRLGSHRFEVTMLGYLIVAGLVVGFAHLWLRRFNLGPVEWLWKLAGNVGLSSAR